MNQETAAFNKALNLGNYTNPFGSQESYISGYDQATGAPIYQTRTTADPAVSNNLYGLLQQSLNNQGISPDAINQMRGINSQLTGLSGQLSPQDAAAAQQRGQNAAYQAQTQYLNPQFAQGQQSLEAKLAAQGLAPGSQAYNNAMLNFQNQKQRAYSDAANQSIMTGSQLGTQNLQNQLAGLNYQTGLLGQQGANLGQMVGFGQIPYQNLGTIANMVPGYQGPANAGAGTADISGAMNQQYQGQLGAYNARQQSNNATTSSLAGLAGMAAMMFF